jgi:putative transcriptional regulator
MKQHAFESLKNHFLVAMPSLNEGIFAHSLTYMCEHSEHGAMGIVINRPLDLRLRDILEHLEIDDIRIPQDALIMAGGPVQTDRGFVLHRASEHSWESTLHITDEIALTTSRDILAAIAHDQGPAAALVALGYAGWSGGQLEDELARNSWLTIPADSAIIFNTPVAQRLNAAAAKLGIDLALLAPGAGHA